MCNVNKIIITRNININLTYLYKICIIDFSSNCKIYFVNACLSIPSSSNRERKRDRHT